KQPPKATPLDSRQLARVRLTLAEQRLATSVLGLPATTRKSRHYAHLHGPLADTLLADMLDTTPCFLGGVAGLHLARGKSRHLEWHWRHQHDGLQKLCPMLPGGQQLLDVGSLWYLDAEHAQLGMLHAGAHATQLLHAPPLRPAETLAFARTLADSPWAGKLPEPQVFDTPRRIDTSPTPALELLALARHPRLKHASGTPLAYARLGFDYAGARLSSAGAEAREPRVHQGQLLDIVRRRADELAAIARREGPRLFPAVDTAGLASEVAETRPDEACLVPGEGHTGAREVNTPPRWLGQRERLQGHGFVLDYGASFPFEVI